MHNLNHDKKIPTLPETRVGNIYKDKKDANSLYIGRSRGGEPKNILGNPFNISDSATREMVISQYAEHFIKEWQSSSEFRDAILNCNGKMLLCFCKPAACHGDVIKAFLEAYAARGEEVGLQAVKDFIIRLNFVRGDLFSTSDHIIAHGCNCEGHMGAGVAKEIKKRYPDAFNKYKEACNAGAFKVGGILPVRAGGKIIVNLATQEEYKHKWEDNSGKLAKIGHITNAVSTMISRLTAKYEETKNPYLLRVSMPMVGCGLGGLNRDDVVAEIGKIAKESKITITIFEI